MPSINNVLAASVVALFATTAQGHMVMATPPPYGSPDNSPLVADGSNFPCKATSNSGATVTDMAIGAPQKLSFLGESVHGGGSCQVSLTTDNPATKSSTWMVIHSIEGGCPAKGVAGNIGADNSATAPDPDTYSFAIPTGIKPGAYTLAWTWFNKVGNREMYMNCASIKVTGGSSKRDDIPLNETDFAAIPELAGRDTPSFPAMFVANIPTSDCLTADSKDVQFPNPGASVEKDGVASDLAPPTGAKCGSASGSSSSGSQAAAPSGGAAAAPSVAASPAAAAPSVAGGSPAAAAPSVAASPAAAAPSVAASPAASPAAEAAPSAPAASPATGSTSSSGSSSGSSTCSSPGAMMCSPDGKSFAICSSSGTAPVFQPVSAGTSCANGAIAAVKVKRSSAKFAKGY